MNRCWNASFIQMLYNIIEYRNSLIFETPSINTDKILKDYDHSKSYDKPADLEKNDNPILLIAALKHIFKRLLRAELLNISYISGFMEHKIFVDFGPPRCNDDDNDNIEISKSYDSHNEINPMLLMFLTINNSKVEEYNNIIINLFNYSYLEHIKYKKYIEDKSLLENFYDKYIIKNYISENSQLINMIRLNNTPDLHKIHKIKTHLFDNDFDETCNNKITYPLILSKDFDKHIYRNLTDCIKNYDKNININNNLHKYHFNKYDSIELNEIDYTQEHPIDNYRKYLKTIFNNKTILTFNENNNINKITLGLDYKKQSKLYSNGIISEYNKYFIDSPKYLLIEIIPNACEYKNGNVISRDTMIDYNNISVPCLYATKLDSVIKFEDNSEKSIRTN